MRYQASTHEEIYNVLRSLPGPLAVLDFFCGELGWELFVSQALGGRFYDENKNGARVVALCWKGCAILYENISDDQIEFADVKASMSGNKRHDGVRRVRKLKYDRMPGNVIACLGPVICAPDAVFRYHKMAAEELLAQTANRLARTQYVFDSPGDRVIEEPYIALFDRNEKHRPGRNTRMWQIKLFHRLAQECGLRLAVISGFYPRRPPGGAIWLKMRHRDLDLLCNVARHSLLWGGPVSGGGEAGLLFGCHAVAFGRWVDRQAPFIRRLVTDRGFRWFGTLDNPTGDVALEVRKYLETA